MNATTFESLRVCRFPDRASLGEAAAGEVKQVIASAIAARGEARVIFACAPSQNEFLAALTADPRAVEWSRVTAFHMDEYVGLDGGAAQSFRHFLGEHLLSRVPGLRAFHPIAGEAPSIEAECARYSALLRERPIDLVCMGIGENGHIAFNDPPVADFDDPHLIKCVELDEACRRQQVNDGCFPSFGKVPTHALTLTIPALCGAAIVSCVVPGVRKAQAVHDTLVGPISTACPASILRRHARATLWIDDAAASLLPATPHE